MKENKPRKNILARIFCKHDWHKLSEFYFFNGIYEARWGDFEKAKENLRLAKENNYYVSNLALQQVVLNDVS